MPALSLGDNVLLTINGEVYGQRIMSTFGYVVSAITGAPDDFTVFNELNVALSAAGELYAKYKLCCPNQYTPGAIWMQVIRPVRYLKRVFTNLSGDTFRDTNCYQANVCAVLLRRGSLGNRRNISTLHIPCGTDVDSLVEAVLTEGMETAVNNLGVKVKTTYTTTTGAVEFSPSILNGPLHTDVTPITVCQAQETVRVMRRRTKGIGI